MQEMVCHPVKFRAPFISYPHPKTVNPTSTPLSSSSPKTRAFQSAAAHGSTKQASHALLPWAPWFGDSVLLTALRSGLEFVQRITLWFRV